MSRRLVLAAVAAAFITGCAAGLIGGILFARSLAPAYHDGRDGPPPLVLGPRRDLGRRFPDGPPEHMVRRLGRELELSDAQLDRILEHVREGRRTTRAARESLHAAMARELTPEQRERFERLLRRSHHPGKDRTRE